MADYTISGIDISKHQGDVDFAKVLEDGQSFCFVKATEGCDYIDTRFVDNWRKMMEFDGVLIRGAYHFGRPDSVGGYEDGKAEAEDFCDTLEAVGGFRSGCLPPVLDYEKYSGKGVQANLAYLDGFVKTVEDRLGRTPMIYTGYNVWRYQTNNTDAYVDYPLWLVAYSRLEYPDRAMSSLPWNEFAFWQWSGGGDYAYGPKVPGIPPDPGTVDLNWFSGTEEDLMKMAMLGDGPRPPAADPDIIKVQALLAKSERLLEDGISGVRGARELLADNS